MLDLSQTAGFTRAVAEVPNPKLRQYLENISSGFAYVSDENLPELLTAIDELIEFTPEELEDYLGYSPVPISETFRHLYLMSLTTLVESFSRGEGKPILLKLLASTLVDAKLFSYLLSVVTYPHSNAEDIYSVFNLVFRDNVLKKEEIELLRRLLKSCGLDSQKVTLTRTSA